MNPNNYHYIVCRKDREWGEHLTCFCINKQDNSIKFFFDKFGINKQLYSHAYNLNCIQDIDTSFIEVDYKEAFLLFNPDVLKFVINQLGVILEPIIVSLEDKEDILNLLRNRKAFNADSAMKVDEKLDIYFALIEQGLIKSISYDTIQKFYIPS